MKGDMSTWVMRNAGTYGYGAAVVFGTMALSFAAFAIAFTLKNVTENEAWRWILLIALSAMAVLLVLWFFWATFGLLFGGARHEVVRAMDKKSY